MDAIFHHFEQLKATGELERKRFESIRYQLGQFVFEEIGQMLESPSMRKRRDELAQQVLLKNRCS